MELKAELLKPYTEQERINFIVEQNHKLNYEIKETEKAMEAWGADNNDLLNEVKQNKILENDAKRDEALNQGVVYRNVLFDSDTDQKVNLLATLTMLEEGQTIIWYGMDNQPLECDDVDLENIGGLITQLHSFCWNKNALIKAEINNAETIDEVEAIVIDYSI